MIVKYICVDLLLVTWCTDFSVIRPTPKVTVKLETNKVCSLILREINNKNVYNNVLFFSYFDFYCYYCGFGIGSVTARDKTNNHKCILAISMEVYYKYYFTKI